MHKKTAVIYILTKLELGGAQKVCLELFNSIPNTPTDQNNQFDTLLISGTQGPLVSQVKNNKRVILLDSFKREVGLKSLFSEVRTFLLLVRHLKKIKKEYSRVIAHTHSTKAGIVGRWAAFFAGIKIRIHTVHGYAFHAHQSWTSWLPIYCAELITSFITTQFICVSTADIKTGKKLLPFFARKNTLIRAAIDTRKFTCFGPTYYAKAEFILSKVEGKVRRLRRASPFIFGTVSCFKPQKNLFDLLRAFKLVHDKHPDTRLELIGDGQQRAALESWIAEHKLTESVLLHGWQKNVAPILAHWDVFTLSSLWEGLPCAIIEARLLKLPVIAYNTGGISDVIVHGKNGFLCQQKNWQQFARYMSMLIEDRSQYMCMRAYQDNLQSFDSSFMIQAHKNLYRSWTQ